MKHIIANKNNYINHLCNFNELNSDGWQISKWIEIVLNTLYGILVGLCSFGTFANFSNGNIPGVIMNLQIMAGVSIPTITYILANRIIRKTRATKKINNKIKDLEAALELEHSKQFDKSLEEIKDLIKESTTPSKKYSNDAFIANIKKDMELVAEIKYQGYQSDLETLYKLAEKYLEAKKEMSTTRPSEVLTTEWFIPLNEIEAKIRKLSKVQEDQSDITETLTEMRELWIKERPKFDEQAMPNSEISGYTPTLKL